MKAVILKDFGGTENLMFTELEKPTPTSHQVVIRVHASSVNPIDYKIRNGMAKHFAPMEPRILHGDVAGTIAAIGSQVTRFKVGDEVYGCIGGVGPRPGALAEFAVADAELLALKPKNLSFHEAAALPLVCVTAWDALIDRANIQKGQTVLVHAGTGGVGHIGIQLAKMRGATVHTTVSSAAKEKLARQLGADAVINYREKTVSEYVSEHTSGRGYDIVFDTVGGTTLEASFAAVRTYGTVVSCQTAHPSCDLRGAAIKALTLHSVLMLLPLLDGESSSRARAHQGEIMTEITRLVERGQLKPLIDDKRFLLEEVGLAHQRAESGQQIGKIVIEVP